MPDPAPLALLLAVHEIREPPPLGPVPHGVRTPPPLGAAPRASAPPHELVPFTRTRLHEFGRGHVPARLPAAGPVAPHFPPLALAGIALLAAAVPLGGLFHRRRTRRRIAPEAVCEGAGCHPHARGGRLGVEAATRKSPPV